MTKFKVGDTISVRSNSSLRQNTQGIIVFVDSMEYEVKWDIDQERTSTYTHFALEQNAELISSNNKGEAMNLMAEFNKMFLKEPEKTYRELGITDDQNLITSDGQKLLLTHLLTKEGITNTFFTDIAKPMLEKRNKNEEKK